MKLQKHCNTDNHHAFDFWLGEWVVTTSTRKGWEAQSSITLVNDGCTVHEHYKTPDGYQGRSLNFYDPQKKQWVQIWIDNTGTPLYLSGNIKNGNMILANETNQITWSLIDKNHVRQHWETTSDGGVTFTTLFDGHYSKK